MTQTPWSLDHEDEEINLAPLLDCIFILVFFFLVATTIRTDEARIQVNLPNAHVEAVAPTRDTIEIVNTEDGEIVIDGVTADQTELEPAIRRAIDEHPRDRVVVRGDARSRLQTFALVVAALSRLNVSDFDLLTEPAETQRSEP